MVKKISNLKAKTYFVFPFLVFTNAWEQKRLGEVCDEITDYVAAGSFADLRDNVVYFTNPNYAQLVRTTDLKSNFTNQDFIYINEQAFNFLWRVNLNRECIIMPNIGNCGEIYYINPQKLPYKHNSLGPNAIYVRSNSSNICYLSFAFLNENFHKSLMLIVSPNGQTKFNKTDLKEINFYHTNNLDEQSKIGQFFSSLDSLITLHQRKCKLYKRRI